MATDDAAGDTMEKTSGEGAGEEDCTALGVSAEPMEAETLTSEGEQKPLQTDSQEGEVEEATYAKVCTYVRVCVCVYTPSSMCYDLAYRLTNLAFSIDFYW